MKDLEHFPKTDAHFHSTFKEAVYADVARKYNVDYININTDVHDVFPPVDEQERVALEYMCEYPGMFRYICTFPMAGWHEYGWMERVKARILRSMEQGALGVKLWKNIGMEVLKPDGTFLMVDDECFDPLFSFLVDEGIPVLAHLGEPRNCWLPLDKMTSERNRRYFEQHPEFHAFMHSEIPSYEKQIEARDKVLQRYPNLTFVGAHLGSLEWNYKELAKRFDLYPNFFADTSSRLGHLELQSSDDYEGVRNFFLNYADRLIYGTDAYNNLEKLETSLVNDWTFLATADSFFCEEMNCRCRGLNLPEDVLHELYSANARRVYHNINS